MYKELDLVILKHDVDEYGLKAGDVGTIVHCYPDNAAYVTDRLISANLELSLSRNARPFFICPVIAGGRQTR